MDEETNAATIDNTPSLDLSPPVFLATTLRQFSEIARARGPQMSEAELERLFTAMLTGILSLCAQSAVQIPDVRQSAIYKLNYMTALRATLASVSAQVPAVQVPLEKASQEVQTLRDQLVEVLSTTLLEDSGVRDLLQELDTRRSHDAPSRRVWLISNLDGAAQRLDDFLSSALMDAQEGLKNLLDRTLAKDIVAEAMERFCSEFEELEGMLEMVDAESAGPEDVDQQSGSLRELYPRSSAEVRALLS